MQFNISISCLSIFSKSILSRYKFAILIAYSLLCKNLNLLKNDSSNLFEFFISLITTSSGKVLNNSSASLFEIACGKTALIFPLFCTICLSFSSFTYLINSTGLFSIILPSIFNSLL